jgi:hypothetical protein
MLLILVGYIFKMMHWPDLFRGLYSGPVLMVLGTVALVVLTQKNKGKNQ